MSSDRYFVIWPDGQKFGPADVPTLQRWAIENRIGSATLLEDAATGRQVRAVDVPAIQSVIPYVGQFAPGPTTFSPMRQARGNMEVTVAWICGAIGIVGVFCCVPLIPSIVGIVFASIAINKRQPGAVWALILNIAGIVLLLGIAALAGFAS